MAPHVRTVDDQVTRDVMRERTCPLPIVSDNERHVGHDSPQSIEIICWMEMSHGIL